MIQLFLFLQVFTNISILYVFSVLPCWVYAPAAMLVTI